MRIDVVIYRIELRFKLRDNLIFYTNFDNDRENFYIFNIFEKKVFELIHDYQYYEKFYRIYNRIINFVYLRYFFKNLRIYIEYYSKYEFN